jgi:flagella basal body P-ring formation protein FlgA
MFIEYAITQSHADPSVVYRVPVRARTLGAAEQVAHGTLEVVRRMFPRTPPNGFQIVDDNDDVVLRSWARPGRPVLHWQLRLLGATASPPSLPSAW